VPPSGRELADNGILGGGLMLAMMLGAGVVQGRLQSESCHVYLECCCKGVVDGGLILAVSYFCPSGKRMGIGVHVPASI